MNTEKLTVESFLQAMDLVCKYPKPLLTLRIVENGWWKQYRFPRSKKKRIRNKWKKKERNYEFRINPLTVHKAGVLDTVRNILYITQTNFNHLPNDIKESFSNSLLPKI